MTLLDGLDYYKTYSDSDWEFTLKVQSLALEVLDLISVYGDHPDSRALLACAACCPCTLSQNRNVESDVPQGTYGDITHPRIEPQIVKQLYTIGSCCAAFFRTFSAASVIPCRWPQCILETPDGAR